MRTATATLCHDDELYYVLVSFDADDSNELFDLEGNSCDTDHIQFLEPCQDEPELTFDFDCDIQFRNMFTDMNTFVAAM